MYLNEYEPFAAEWLRNLIEAGELPPGTVDTRSIKDVQPSDLQDFETCHFFAGIGGWPYALRLAGWPDASPVWTGSCPCQPFSAAGKRKGTADERHLWPEFHRLIAKRRPSVVFGEQVASKDGRGWIARVRADLEALGYAVGVADLCAAGEGSPHIRQRLYWVADANCPEFRGQPHAGQQPLDEQDGSTSRMADDSRDGRRQRHSHVGGSDSRIRAQGDGGGPSDDGWAGGVAIECADGNLRRIERSAFPLAHGIPRDVGQRFPELRSLAKGARSNRTGRLRGYGNAIVPQVAATFIRAFMETQT
jgi:DNA (cytosine-5)-methyltransferase 1